MKALAIVTCASILGLTTNASAQSVPPEAGTRAALIVEQQREKAKTLQPYQPNKAELWVKELEEQFLLGNMKWHPFFENAYAGGGFTLGAGYLEHLSAYNTLDVRGSYTFSAYKRIESEFRAPRLLGRRATLSLLGGWREATQVGYFGTGMTTSQDDRVNYSFRQPYASATLEFRPKPRHWVVFTGAVEYSEWNQRPGKGSHPSVETVYSPETLPGLGASPTYIRTTTTAAIDWRDAPDYTRRGGYYGVTWSGYSDGADNPFGFGQVDYEVIQHLPLFRDAWVLSLRGRVSTTYTNDGESIPFFMLPSLGGGSTMRGFSSWRFRDNHSLLLQAEWRTLVSNFFDLAIFYDAGKVTARRSDLDLDGLKNDVGIGLRLHGPLTTPVRIELAKGNEGLHLVFSAHASF
jgi:hypothetical protein